ncbi:hypothetical protein D3C86_1764780 [compost metagenome]
MIHHQYRRLALVQTLVGLAHLGLLVDARPGTRICTAQTRLVIPAALRVRLAILANLYVPNSSPSTSGGRSARLAGPGRAIATKCEGF